jgi:hypothetical protein
MPGAQPHPQPRMQMKKHTRFKSLQVRRNNPAFPARWFTGLYVLSPGYRAC